MRPQGELVVVNRYPWSLLARRSPCGESTHPLLLPARSRGWDAMGCSIFK
ncbi:unnamed protein product [Amoebophrya sp. A25]|nr:unnamed protein product [Amoebophrya sp. A25]|eukprot:GSA25T00020013001.1